MWVMSFLQCTGTVAVLLLNLHFSHQEIILFFSLKRWGFFSWESFQFFSVRWSSRSLILVFQDWVLTCLVQELCSLQKIEKLDCDLFNCRIASKVQQRLRQADLARFQNYRKLRRTRNLIKEIGSLSLELGKSSMQSKNGNLRTQAQMQILHLMWIYANDSACTLFA